MVVPAEQSELVEHFESAEPADCTAYFVTTAVQQAEPKSVKAVFAVLL